jgi:hypothetical protein
MVFVRNHIERAMAMFTSLVVALSLGCVAHPGLPATTEDAFAAKGASTAEAAASTTATVSLALGAERDRNTTASYLDAVLSGQEDILDGVRSGYASLRPPTAASAREQRRMLRMLDDASDHVREVRVRLDLGDRAGALRLRAALDRDTRRLQERQS